MVNLHIFLILLSMDWTDTYIRQRYSKSSLELPRLIFLDTNVVQYLSDFGEFIFEYQWDEEQLVTPRGKELKRYSVWQRYFKQ